MNPHDTDSERATLLPVMFGLLLGMIFLTFLVMITGGLFFYVILIAGGLALMGCVHYVIWGKLMQERTEGEREEAELLDRVRDEGSAHGERLP